MCWEWREVERRALTWERCERHKCWTRTLVSVWRESMRRSKVETENTSADIEANDTTGDTALQLVSCLHRCRRRLSQNSILTTVDEGAHIVLNNLLTPYVRVASSRLLEFYRIWNVRALCHTHTLTRNLSFSLAHSLARPPAIVCVRVCVGVTVCLSVSAHFCFHSRLRVIVVVYPISVCCMLLAGIPEREIAAAAPAPAPLPTFSL